MLIIKSKQNVTLFSPIVAKPWSDHGNLLSPKQIGIVWVRKRVYGAFFGPVLGSIAVFAVWRESGCYGPLFEAKNSSIGPKTVHYLLYSIDTKGHALVRRR
ncbi:MAG: hypothetical protein RI897_63 [Verrucomicrobiota bacterium]